MHLCTYLFYKRFRDSVNVDKLCNGQLCPRRWHYGLLVIHAWTPNSKNSITADHVVYNFIRLNELEKYVEESNTGRNFAADSVLKSKGKICKMLFLVKKLEFNVLYY